jgi:hypothetical protein
MAEAVSIAKAQAAGLALQTVFGVQPSFLYNPDHVRIYFEPDRLKTVQTKIASMATAGPSDVRVDWLPLVAPLAIKKALPFAVGLLVAGYLFGKLQK